MGGRISRKKSSSGVSEGGTTIVEGKISMPRFGKGRTVEEISGRGSLSRVGERRIVEGTNYGRGSLSKVGKGWRTTSEAGLGRGASFLGTTMSSFSSGTSHDTGSISIGSESDANL